MLRSVARLSRMAAGTSLRRLFISTTSAASMATSVPAPMAMPMSARVSAGASLMPSPTMATLPRALQAADLALLAVGQHARDHLVHAGLRADGPGRALVVAREHDDADAHILQLPDGLRAVLLDARPPRRRCRAASRRGLKNSGVLPCLGQRLRPAPAWARECRRGRADEVRVAAAERSARPAWP